MSKIDVCLRDIQKQKQKGRCVPMQQNENDLFRYILTSSFINSLFRGVKSVLLWTAHVKSITSSEQVKGQFLESSVRFKKCSYAMKPWTHLAGVGSRPIFCLGWKDTEPLTPSLSSAILLEILTE